MMKWIKRARAILRGKRGESLMEGLASLFVYAVLMTTITMTLLVSLRITGNATRIAQSDQVIANAAITGDDTDIDDVDIEMDIDTEIIEFIFGIDGTDIEIKVPITVTVNTVNGLFRAFIPE